MKNHLIERMNSDDEYAIHEQEAEEYYRHWHSIPSESMPLPPTDWQVRISDEAPF